VKVGYVLGDGDAARRILSEVEGWIVAAKAGAEELTASLAIVRERDVGADHHDDGAVQALRDLQRGQAITRRSPVDTSPAG
jgi:hypothetical protein